MSDADRRELERAAKAAQGDAGAFQAFRRACERVGVSWKDVAREGRAWPAFVCERCGNAGLQGTTLAMGGEKLMRYNPRNPKLPRRVDVCRQCLAHWFEIRDALALAFVLGQA